MSCENAIAARSYLLQSDAQAPNRRVTAVVEVKGELKLNEQGNGVRRTPIRAKAELSYDERLSNSDAEVRRDIRFYRTARAKVRVGEAEIESKLPDGRRLIAVQTDAERQLLFCPRGPLSRDHLELVDVQCSSTLLNRLVPNCKCEVGEQWSHNEQLLAMLFGLDAVSASDVQSTLRKVEDQIAIIDLSGTISGAVGGVVSDIKLHAKYNFDLSSRQVTWMATTIKEDRAIGHAEPGLDVVARVRVAIFPGQPTPELSDDVLAQVAREPVGAANLLDFSSTDGGFRFVHSRDWRLMVDRHNVSIMRLVDEGDLLAQCNASNLPPLEKGQIVTLQVFQADIQRALGDDFGQLVEVNETQNQHAHRVLRVVASGTASGLPVQWWYHHISDAAGRQASVVFTMDEKSLERFAGQDQVVIDSFDFLARENTTTPVSVEKR